MGLHTLNLDPQTHRFLELLPGTTLFAQLIRTAIDNETAHVNHFDYDDKRRGQEGEGKY